MYDAPANTWSHLGVLEDEGRLHPALSRHGDIVFVVGGNVFRGSVFRGGGRVNVEAFSFNLTSRRFSVMSPGIGSRWRRSDIGSSVVWNTPPIQVTDNHGNLRTFSLVVGGAINPPMKGQNEGFTDENGISSSHITAQDPRTLRRYRLGHLPIAIHMPVAFIANGSLWTIGGEGSSSAHCIAGQAAHGRHSQLMFLTRLGELQSATPPRK
jgi:hypothetical protein